MIDPILKFIHMPGQELIADWSMPEDTYVVADKARMHPFIIAQMVASIEGPDAGFDLLRKYLHEDIDRKFKALAFRLEQKYIFEETGMLIYHPCNH